MLIVGIPNCCILVCSEMLYGEHTKGAIFTAKIKY